jgi:hypothetical protein
MSQWRGGEADKNRRRWHVSVGSELRWPTAPVGRPCSTRGPRRGERRSAMRTRVVGGVSSPCGVEAVVAASISRWGGDGAGGRGG